MGKHPSQNDENPEKGNDVGNACNNHESRNDYLLVATLVYTVDNLYKVDGIVWTAYIIE